MGFYGRCTIFTAMAPNDGLLLIRFESPPVLEGDTLAVVAVLNASDGSCGRLVRDLRSDGRASTDNRVLPWRWAAATGWIVALGLGCAIGRGRGKRKSGSYRRAGVSIGEEGTSDAPRVV